MLKEATSSRNSRGSRQKMGSIAKATSRQFRITFKLSKRRETKKCGWVCGQDHEPPKDGPCFTVDFEKTESPFYESTFSSDCSRFRSAQSAASCPGRKRITNSHRKGRPTSSWTQAAASKE